MPRPGSYGDPPGRAYFFWWLYVTSPHPGSPAVVRKDAPHHRAVPTHKGRKSRLVLAADVVRQQLLIGQPSPVLQKHRPAKVLDDPVHLAHRRVPHRIFLALLAFSLTTTGTRAV